MSTPKPTVSQANDKPYTIEPGTEMEEYELAPGVKGYAIEQDGRIYIPVVRAAKEGNGDVGRFLDRCTTRCVFPNVVSARFAAMLQRRGFHQIVEIDEHFGAVHVWIR